MIDPGAVYSVKNVVGSHGRGVGEAERGEEGGRGVEGRGKVGAAREGEEGRERERESWRGLW
eukprot:589690-Hanusia_phi.AAC.1